MAFYRDGGNSKTVLIYFIQYGASCSKEMRSAFSICQEAKLQPKIVSEEDVREIELSSNVVFVLENFNGDIFEYLCSRDCLVVGPLCIRLCISEKIEIPNNGSPVFNIALRGFVLCSTSLDAKDKVEIRKLACFMGAIYSDDLTLAVTHLIAEKASLQSAKFVKACENNIPVVSPDWIKKSWEISQMDSKAPNFRAFTLPPFRGMHISCSNLSMSVKKKLQSVIEANGGIYQRTLELHKTAVLVIGDPEGKKWQHAQQWGIPCVTPSWIYESAEKGCLAPSKNHLVVPRPRCSTPTKSEENNSFMSCSDISVVPMSSERSNIDESNMTMSSAGDISVQSVRSEVKNKKKLSQDGTYKKLLEEITLADIKAAGYFLDGCKIYLSGFTTTECEKLKKIINSGGATLYTSISDSLSHVVVGDFSLVDAKSLSSLLPRPHVVKLEWLIQCLKEKRIIGVEPYLCLQSTPAPPASPLSHKGLKLLKSQNGFESPTTPNESKTQVSRKLFVKSSVLKQPLMGMSEMESTSIDVSALERRALEEMNREKEEQLKKELELKNQEAKTISEEQQKTVENKIQEQSKLSKQASIVNNFTSNDGDQSTMEPFFQDLRFEILGFDEILPIQESIELVGGQLVTGNSDVIPDYAIVPVEGTELKITATKVVSIIFVEDCYDQGSLISELEYYHQPIYGLADVDKKLDGTVFGLSGFSRAERRLLIYVATKLGAIVQDMFSRTDHPDRGVKKSTHLICKEMSGKKYEAAMKWGIPVVPPSWLLRLVENQKSERSSKSLGKTVQENTADEETERDHSLITQPLEDNANGEPNITPVNQILRRLSCPGSAGPSPFHVQTPETPYGKVLTDCTPSPDTRKRWKKWIDNFPDHYEGSPSTSAKPKRPSTPLDVIKKQLWVKFGGVHFDGIEPGTGKIDVNGPLGEWASNNTSFESLAAEAEELKSKLNASSSGEKIQASDIIEAIHTRHSSVRTPDPEVLNREDGLSTRFELSQECQSNSKQFLGQEWEDKQHVMWDFEPAKSSPNLSNADVVQTPVENVSNKFKEINLRVSDPAKALENPKENIPSNNLETSKRPYKSTKLLTSESHEKSALAVCDSPDPVPKKIPRIEAVKVKLDENFPVFLLSGLPANIKLKYEGIIRQLNGGVTQCPSYDPETTHIIVEKPIRSEKLLCCIASGKWVLHSSYVDNCYEARKFLPEEEFEWGNQLSAGRLPTLKPGSTEEGLANASFRWRQRKNDLGSASPFRDMKVVLFTSDNKLPQFKRLLKAGDATILENSEISKANFIIWEEGKCHIPVRLEELAKRKVHVVPPVYLGEYLVKTPPPSEYYPESYAKFFKSKRTSIRR